MRELAGDWDAAALSRGGDNGFTARDDSPVFLVSDMTAAAAAAGFQGNSVIAGAIRPALAASPGTLVPGCNAIVAAATNSARKAGPSAAKAGWNLARSTPG